MVGQASQGVARTIPSAPLPHAARSQQGRPQPPLLQVRREVVVAFTKSLTRNIWPTASRKRHRALRKRAPGRGTARGTRARAKVRGGEHYITRRRALGSQLAPQPGAAGRPEPALPDRVLRWAVARVPGALPGSLPSRRAAKTCRAARAARTPRTRSGAAPSPLVGRRASNPSPSPSPGPNPALQKPYFSP
eukprot:scaffold21676_cov60-Phaeocystis_antarctica.AAC.7